MNYRIWDRIFLTQGALDTTVTHSDSLYRVVWLANATCDSLYMVKLTYIAFYILVYMFPDIPLDYPTSI